MANEEVCIALQKIAFRETATCGHASAQAEPPAHADPDILPQEALRKYTTYAKQHCKPKLQNADYDKIAAVRASALRASCMSHGAIVSVAHPVSSNSRHLACWGRAQRPPDKDSCASACNCVCCCAKMAR